MLPEMKLRLYGGAIIFYPCILRKIILKLAVSYDKINLTVRQTGFQGVIYGKILKKAYI